MANRLSLALGTNPFLSGMLRLARWSLAPSNDMQMESCPSHSGPFKGHTGGVLSIAFSPDGKQIVSGSWDKSICISDAETGEMVSGPLKDTQVESCLLHFLLIA